MAPKTRDESETPQKAPGFLQRVKPAVRRAGALLANPLALGVVGLAVGSLLVATVVVPLMLRGRRAVPRPVTPAMAMAALDRGNVAEARRVAERLQQQKGLSIADSSVVAYVLGIDVVLSAKTAPESQRRERYLEAARLLRQACKNGFPDGREATGLYLLAKCLYLSGAVSAARPFLESALAVDSQHAPELRRLLLDARLTDDPSASVKALAENDSYLADKKLTSDDRDEGLLQRARILLRLGRLNECGETLDRLPAQSPLRDRIGVLRGRLFYHRRRKVGTAPDSRRPIPKKSKRSSRRPSRRCAGSRTRIRSKAKRRGRRCISRRCASSSWATTTRP